MLKETVTRERYPNLVGAVFERKQDATDAAHALQTKLGFNSQQVSIIEPGDRDFGRRLEPETRKIASTLWHSHLRLGGAGAAIGCVVGLVLGLAGPPATQSSPLLLPVVLTVLGGFTGMLFAGFVSLRPDHDPLIQTIRHAIQNNQAWAVVVRTASEKEKFNAEQALRQWSRKTTTTI